MNILTFDIEEWFHILDNKSTETEKEWAAYDDRLLSNMEKIFDLLERKHLKATFYCLGWVARKYPHIVKKIDALGYEIASHSDMHQLAYEQDRREFRQDLENSIKAIENITGKKLRSFRAPGFSFKEENMWVFEVMIENGIEIDSSIFPAKRTHGGLRNFGTAEPALVEIDGVRIKEFPINLFQFLGKNIVFSGGGYFRLFPYCIIKRLMRKSNYVMTYFHPRDFDPKQPVISELSLVRKFKSYYGLQGAFRKLENLVEDFKLIDLKEADTLVDWDNAKVIKLKAFPSKHSWDNFRLPSFERKSS